MVSPEIVAATAGFLSHVLYFRNGEHHLYSNRYIQATVTILPASVAYIHHYQQTAWPEAITQTLILAGWYFTSLFTSLLIYRIVFHPLAKFPGPLGARISALWFTSKLGTRNAHKLLLKLHEQYGPIIRIGPSDLSIINPSAVSKIYGSSSRCSKGPFYDFSAPVYSLQSFRDRAIHDQSRRVWSNAFSDKLLRGYEERIKVYRRKLIDSFAKQEGQPVDVRKWFNLYTFDVMGDLAFGEGFESLDRGEDHWAVQMLIATMEFVGLYIPPWMWPIAKAIPAATRDFHRFTEYCGSRLKARMETKTDIPDISTAFITPLNGRKPTEGEWHVLTGDSRLIIVAGSDTSAASLGAIFYELARHPEEIEKLRNELAPHMDEKGEFPYATLATLDHLNGVINEALRLYPPVPSVLPRQTPPEGLEIDGVYIPGDMSVYCPQYVIGRSELAYAKPTEFIPERWYAEPNLVKEKSAFAPFNIGPYGCIGKPLAMLNLRATTAQLLMEFDVDFAPGEDGREFVETAHDNFVLYMGRLEMVFRRRSTGR